MRQSQATWQARKLGEVPGYLAPFLNEGHGRRFGQATPESTSPWYAPNQWLVQTVSRLKGSKLWKAFDEHVIHTQAENAARLCSRMVRADKTPWFERRADFALSAGIDPPVPDRLKTPEGCAARLADPMWWRRQFRKTWTRSAEGMQRELGLVRRGVQPYASDQAVFFRAAMQRRMMDFLLRYELVNQEYVRLPLQQVAEHSLSNPALRRGEMMTRTNGLEKWAHAHGHDWMFGTLTAPSAFHPQLAQGGANPRYNGSTVRQAQAWLIRMWSKIRALSNKHKVSIYGMRSAEPHHDGTPHWHMLIFGTRDHLQFIKRTVSKVFLSEFADEPGAAEHRVNWIDGDARKGTATGYLAKYISKNIDGYGGIGASEDLETGASVHAGTVRVEAWARTYGIRQFQQFGSPAISIWREFRRVRKLEVFEDFGLSWCWFPADAGRYAEFLLRCQDVASDGVVQLQKLDRGRKNRYGEARGPCVVGLRRGEAVQITRNDEWKITPCGKPVPLKAFACSRPSSDSGSAGKPAETRTSMNESTKVPRGAAATLEDPPEFHDCFGAMGHAMHHRREERAAFRRFWDSILHLGPVAITVTAACVDPATLGAERAAFERWKTQKQRQTELRHAKMMDKLARRCSHVGEDSPHRPGVEGVQPPAVDSHMLDPEVERRHAQMMEKLARRCAEASERASTKVEI